MFMRKASIPLVQAIRSSSHAPAPIKFTGQHPNAFVHDGWASARLPFHVTNKWLFATKAISFLALGFWAPFVVVEYQLRKANSQ